MRGFNIDHLHLSKSEKLCQFMEKHLKAKPLISDKTTDYHSLLDQIYSLKPAISAGVLETVWSDHKIVWAFI